MHKSAQGTPDRFRVCGKHDLVLHENSEQLKAQEPGFGDRTPRRGAGCASEDRDRIRLLPTLRGCPGRPQTTTSTLDGVLHCTSHLGARTLCPAAPGGNGAGQGAPARAVLPASPRMGRLARHRPCAWGLICLPNLPSQDKRGAVRPLVGSPTLSLNWDAWKHCQCWLENA